MARKPKLKLSAGAMHARAKFEEAKHKRDISGKFADKPGTEIPTGGKGAAKTAVAGAGGAPGGAPKGGATTAEWQASAKTSGVVGDDQIKLHVTANPKKPGSASAERFAKYKDGMTADGFIAAGGTREDLAWDRKKGFITIHDPPTYQKLSGSPGSATAEINPVGATGRLASIKGAVEKPPTTLVEAAAPKAPGTPPKPAAPAVTPKAVTPKPAEVTAPKPTEVTAPKPAEVKPKLADLNDEDVIITSAGHKLSVKNMKATAQNDSAFEKSINAKLAKGDYTVTKRATVEPTAVKQFSPEDTIEAFGQKMTVEQWKKSFAPHLTEAQAQEQLAQFSKQGKFKITPATAEQKAAKLAKDNAIAARKAEVEANNKLHLEQIAPAKWKDDPRWGKAAGTDSLEKRALTDLEKTQQAMGLKFNGKDNKSVAYYSGEEGADVINTTLRNKTYDQLSPINKKHTDALDELTNDTTKEDGIMWRGIGVHGDDLKNINNMPPPNEFTDLGYTSLSFDPQVARNFTGQSKSGVDTIFRVRVPKGTKAAHIGGYETTVKDSLLNEAEVITARGTRFKYISTTKGAKIGSGTYNVIEVEIVHNNGKAITKKINLPTPKPLDYRYKKEELFDLPASSMADENGKGLEWEYEVEYKKYGGKTWGPGIKDQEDFNKRYAAAPLTYLKDDEYNRLGYTNIDMNKLPTYNDVFKQIGHRRDPAAIRDRMFNGTTTPPIVLRKKNGELRLMAGQSRILTGFASGFRVPVKVFDV